MKSKLFEREIAVESGVPYRKDIQILRGISILLVVLFHLKAEGFTSGFLGVDIFFVVSGFLMACLYDPARKANFLAKRASRILPAYFTVIVSTLALSVAITTPNDLSQVVEQSIFATAFLSNIGFWFENSYFDKAAFKPLLHFWSLGVEIQFYLLVPLLHWLVSRSKFGYWVLLLASLLACFFIVGISPKTSFFMMPLRLWEFLLGYGVATYGRSYAIRDNSGVKWIGVLGLAVLIAIPMMRVDGTTLNYLQGHPGMYALAVALATSIVLAVGLPESVENLKAALIFEKLGKYSYSIYLVHFPVIVLFLYRPFSGTVLGASRVEQFFS